MTHETKIFYLGSCYFYKNSFQYYKIAKTTPRNIRIMLYLEKNIMLEHVCLIITLLKRLPILLFNLSVEQNSHPISL